MFRRIWNYLTEDWWTYNHKLLAKKVANGKATDHEVRLLDSWNEKRGKVTA